MACCDGLVSRRFGFGGGDKIRSCRRTVFQWRVATVWFLVALVLVVVTRFVPAAALFFNGVLRRSALSLLSFPGACVSCPLFPPRLLRVATSVVVRAYACMFHTVSPYMMRSPVPPNCDVVLLRCSDTCVQ
ncbi:hypothetical protein ARMSODRAFT_523445 [Armillaria solidipes]|uniref:Transmembrane protein n=1 Tax=Armillaria solidipes TaxID=1076256 RepID=A0A2H3B1X2_9AGAR|nr:hypothetical protein ARMSODRAFT_523445 [Armillaria solidipes]